MDAAPRETSPVSEEFTLLQQFSEDLIGPIRSRVVAQLHRWGMPSLVESGRLIASELCSNVQHAGDRRLELQMLLLNQEVRLAVRDYSTVLPTFPVEAPSLDAVSGRGLYLVAMHARRCGVNPLRDGKVVWAVLAPDSYVAPEVWPTPQTRR
jgi:hypothetical protein